ncbi:MAG: CotH kinase family protein [Candidatus Pelethousia sp.]|nr:CotH kinase family protein [Candidatus Pelethousia sp.]
MDEGISGRYDIPVISLSTAPANLFDYETGIYVAGKVRDDWLGAHPETAGSLGLPANYNQEGKLWERPAYFELFDPGGKLCISQGVGVSTHGGYSLDHPNKSLSILADVDYDARDIFNYDFFSEGADKYLPLNGVILRNSATDAKYSLFRDSFIQSLADPEKLDLQASRPCIAFINGEYYGIYNIRPLYRADYLARKYGFETGDTVIIKNPTGGIGDEVQEGFAGDELPYSALLTFIKSADIKKPENYAYVKSQIDIDNYIEYNILEIYCGNKDWLANNVRIWRKRTQTYDPQAPYGQDGRWRWLVYDLDAGYGLFYTSYEENSLAIATAAGGDRWYNTDEFTVMLRTLLTNEEFKTSFITRFADLLNTSFSALNAQARLDALLEIYLPYVPQHILRWNLHNGSMDSYLSEIDRMRAYAQNRPHVIRGHIREYFKLSGINRLKVSVSGEGSVRLNTLLLGAESLPFVGFYFPDIPITLEAIPAQGYRFVGWEGSIASENQTLAVSLTSPAKLRAIFIPASQ